jgi:hypothetical protein
MAVLKYDINGHTEGGVSFFNKLFSSYADDGIKANQYK